MMSHTMHYACTHSTRSHAPWAQSAYRSGLVAALALLEDSTRKTPLLRTITLPANENGTPLINKCFGYPSPITPLCPHCLTSPWIPLPYQFDCSLAQPDCHLVCRVNTKQLSSYICNTSLIVNWWCAQVMRTSSTRTSTSSIVQLREVKYRELAMCVKHIPKWHLLTKALNRLIASETSETLHNPIRPQCCMLLVVHGCTIDHIHVQNNEVHVRNVLSNQRSTGSNKSRRFSCIDLRQLKLNWNSTTLMIYSSCRYRENDFTKLSHNPVRESRCRLSSFSEFPKACSCLSACFTFIATAIIYIT